MSARGQSTPEERPPDRRSGGRSSQDGGAVDKALRVLHELAACGSGARTLADIAAGAGVLKPSTYRILSTFVASGHAIAVGGGRYRPGPRLRALGAEIVGGFGHTVTELLTDLGSRVNHTVHLAVRAGDHAVYTHKVETDQPYRMASRVGMRLPLHSTAIGRCVLAHLPPPEADALLDPARLTPHTPKTITSPDRLRAELARIRERGWAIDDEENELAVRCVGAPVLDDGGSPLGGVSVSALAALTPVPDLEAIAPLVLATARALAPLIA